MEVITDASKIDKALVSMMKKYKKYHIATAWASLGSKASDELLKNKAKIQKMVVGTHFYQTHPDFMEIFIESEQVKFILQTDGVYHPKVYIFSNTEQDWECIIGSANFTLSALTKNSEVVVHIKNTDSDSSNIYENLMDTVENYWVNAESISQKEHHNYKNIWNKNRKKLNSLKGTCGKSRKKKPLIKSQIFSLDWSEYFELIKNDEFHSFAGRIDLLAKAQQYFRQNANFSQLHEIQRREIAGIATKNQTNSDIDWGWFGSMVGAGKFQNRINTNNIFISNALDTIPLQGKIYKSDYNSFVGLFQQAFPDGGAGVAIASRLLAMKRPGYFVCLDKQNNSRLCEEFGISKSVSFESYWSDIIERIIDSVWWSSNKPENSTEVQAWLGRTAMLDAIFYEE